MRRPPRRHRRDREDEDVGGLHVPRPAAAQPLGNVLDQRDQGEQRRLYEQCRRDQEDAGRVVALVAGRPHDEELRHRNTDGENDELEPIARVPVELGEERHRDGERGSADEQEVGERLRRQLRAALDTAHALDRIFEWNRAHSARPMPFMPRVSFDAAENRKQLIRPDRPVRRVCRRWGRGIPRSRHDPEFPRKGESGPASRPARCLTALREGKCRGGDDGRLRRRGRHRGGGSRGGVRHRREHRTSGPGRGARSGSVAAAASSSGVSGTPRAIRRALVTGCVLPGDVAPGDIAPGDVAPGDVAPRDRVPGDVAPGDIASTRPRPRRRSP